MLCILTEVSHGASCTVDNQCLTTGAKCVNEFCACLSTFFHNATADSCALSMLLRFLFPSLDVMGITLHFLAHLTWKNPCYARDGSLSYTHCYFANIVLTHCGLLFLKPQSVDMLGSLFNYLGCLKLWSKKGCLKLIVCLSVCQSFTQTGKFV